MCIQRGCSGHTQRKKYTFIQKLSSKIIHDTLFLRLNYVMNCWFLVFKSRYEKDYLNKNRVFGKVFVASLTLSYLHAVSKMLFANSSLRFYCFHPIVYVCIGSHGTVKYNRIKFLHFSSFCFCGCMQRLQRLYITLGSALSAQYRT